MSEPRHRPDSAPGGSRESAETARPEAAPDSTKRFSDRVANYVRYRPGYPEALLRTLRDEAGLGPGSQAADVGSGTGISTELLLRSGAEVWAVEPNAEMRRAAEERLGGEPRFCPKRHSVTQYLCAWVVEPVV